MSDAEGMSASMTDAQLVSGAKPDVDKGPDYGQFVVVGVLVVIGLFTLISTWDVKAGFSGGDPLGPRFMPLVVGIGLLALAAFLAVAALRGDRGVEDDGEDIDLSLRPDWVTVGKLAGLVAVAIALMDFLGWAIVGGLLFCGAARILGSRTPVRDLVIGAVLSVGSFYAFYVGLGVPIPPGILDGIL
jgi:putative tricarboxylic transport membrane protein